MVGYTARKQALDMTQNRESILQSLRESPKTFKELDDTMPFSHTTLSKHLDDLEEKKMITKIIHQEKRENKQVYKQIYKLTEKGESAYNEIFMLQNLLTQVKERSGKYLSGGVPLQPGTPSESDDYEPLFWPIVAHLAVDKNIENILQIIPQEQLINLQEDFLWKILENIRTKGIPIDENKEGSIIFGMEINYSDLVKTIKNNSFAKWKKLWRKEGAINTIWVQDSITSTKSPYVMKNKLMQEKHK